MPFDPGDVILVPFPFTNQQASKKRPAVVISARTYNDSRPDLIIMAITSQIHPTLTIGEVHLADWHQAGLLKPSAIKPVVATIEQPLILRHLGRLSPSDRQALQTVIGILFKL